MTRACLAMALVLGTACGEDELRRGPTIVVERKDASGCYRPCAPGPVVAPAGADWPGPRCDNIAAAEQCVFEGGRSEGRVIAWLEDVAAKDPLKNLASTVAIRVASSTVETLSLAVSPSASSTAPPMITATFTAPAVETDALSFLVRTTDNYFAESGAFRIAAPTLSLSVAPCATQPCTLGRGTAAILTVTVEAPANLAGDKATVTARVDGALDQQQITADFQPRGRHLKVATLAGLTAPDRGSFWQIDAVVGRVSASTTIALTSPELRLSLPTCPEPSCTLPSVGVLPVELSAPRALRASEAQLQAFIDDRPHGPPAPVPLSSTGLGVRGSHLLALPDLPGRTLRLEARAGTATATGLARVFLTDPPPLEVCVSTATPSSNVLPASCPPLVFATTEWAPCSPPRVNVAVRSQIPPEVGSVPVTLEADAPIFGGSTTATVRLDAEGFGWVSGVLPAISATGHLIRVRQGTLPAITARIARAPVAVEGGSLLPSDLAIRVTAAGSALNHSLTGRVIPPPGVALPAGSLAEIRAYATSTSTAPLDCRGELAESLLDCQPSSGACLLTPSRLVPIIGDTFTVALQGGLCFRGEVLIEAWADVYTTRATEGCLGSRQVARARIGASRVTLNR